MKKYLLAFLLVIALACGLPNYISTPALATTTPTVTITPSPTPTQPLSPTPTIVPPTSTPTPQPVSSGEYVVQAGDTLFGIEERSGVPVMYLAEVNHIQNIDLINVGQVLKIPVWPPPTTKLIVVKVSEQKVYVYDSGTLVNTFIVGTGVEDFPTSLGHFRVYARYKVADMSWPGYYYIKAVPWIMYFNEGQGLHGAPWNHNLGHPASHGCVNMSVKDAEWLYHWSDYGTPVLVTY